MISIFLNILHDLTASLKGVAQGFRDQDVQMLLVKYYKSTGILSLPLKARGRFLHLFKNCFFFPQTYK